MEIQRNIPLAAYSTLRVGGAADFFCEPTSEEELLFAVRFARERGLPIFVLGGGSNVLFQDEGFRGLVLVTSGLRGITWREKADGTLEVVVAAGEDWDAFVGESVARGLGGLENLSLIPGTVGAAPVQNIGAYGAEVKDTITEVTALDTKDLTIKTFSNVECEFAYRDSVFKRESGRYIVLRVAFLLSRHAAVNISYKDVARYFDERGETTPARELVREAVIRIREEKLPDPRLLGTAGSFFKNPIIAADAYQVLLLKFPNMPHYDVGEGKYKIAAAWLIDSVCGLRGMREGSVGSFPRQALAIVNYGGASAIDIVRFSEHVRTCVEAKTGISLEYEVRVVETQEAREAR